MAHSSRLNAVRKCMQRLRRVFVWLFVVHCCNERQGDAWVGDEGGHVKVSVCVRVCVCVCDRGAHQYSSLGART